MHPLSPFTSTNVAILFHGLRSGGWFKAVLKSVAESYNFASIEDFEKYVYGELSFNNRCLVCFDDGDRSFIETAYPVLEEMDVPCALFVSPRVVEGKTSYWFDELKLVREHLDDEYVKRRVSDCLGFDFSLIKPYRLNSVLKCMKNSDVKAVLSSIMREHCLEDDGGRAISRRELIEVHKSGLVSVGAHTINHPVLKNESDTTALREIEDSLSELGDMLGYPVRYFAYPDGKRGFDFGEREKETLKKGGVQLAFTTNCGFIRSGMDPLNVPRVGFSESVSGGKTQVKAKLYLAPFWDGIRGIIMRDSETNERAKLMSLGVF